MQCKQALALKFSKRDRAKSHARDLTKTAAATCPATLVYCLKSKSKRTDKRERFFRG
jgi:hypothetical protein